MSQVDASGTEHPVAFASRALNTSERNYSTTERECLAVVWGLDHFRHFIYGQNITLVTDHKPLKWLLQTKSLNTRLTRWALKVSEYSVDAIDYKKGSEHTNADGLSRLYDGVIMLTEAILKDHDGLQLDNIALLQHGDENLTQIINFLEGGTWPTEILEKSRPYFLDVCNFVLSDGVLYKNHPSNKSTSRQDGLLLVIPKTLK